MKLEKDRLTEEIRKELRQEEDFYKEIYACPIAYRPMSAVYDYYFTPFALLGMLSREMEQQQAAEQYLEMLKERRKKLEQIADPKELCWFIWGKNMPCGKPEEDYDYTDCVDNPGFRPFLLPYLLTNPSEAKGIMIVIAGGGYWERSNLNEGYPVAEQFRRLGYNTLVLQRRVKPFEPVDCMLDLQRAVRWIRHYGEKKGLGGLDCICAVGFSGGSATILGQIANWYGDISPKKQYAHYQPDEVDNESSDMRAVICMYGTAYDFADMSGKIETANPNLPAVFIGCGTEDEIFSQESVTTLYHCLLKKTVTELHLFAGAGHGFGLGLPKYTQKRQLEQHNAAAWPSLADAFIENCTGLKQQVVPNRYNNFVPLEWFEE